jgi:glycosyltransferase involved in cell wall biosynthesis
MIPAGLKVSLVLNDLRVGGSEKQALLLGRHLAEAAADVTVIGLTNRGELVAECERYGLRTLVGSLRYELSPYYAPLNCLKAVRLLNRARPDVIVGYTSSPNTYCGALWRRTTARLFLWNQRDSGLHRAPAFLEKRAVRNTSLFVSNSRGGAAFLDRALGVPQDRVHLVPNGVEVPPAEERMDLRPSLGLAKEDFVASMVGSIRPPKDHLTLIRAWGRVVAGNPRPQGGAVLLILGREQEGHEGLLREVRDAGLDAHIRFLGHRDDVHQVLASSDIGIFSSRSEGMPNGVLECMAAGLAVVASDLEGTRECLGGPQRSLLVPPGDDAAMAEKVLELMRHDDARGRAGRLNRDHVRTHYSSAKMAKRMAGLICRGLEEA